MGGSSKKVTVGYRYYLGEHMVLTHGPADKFLRVRVDGRDAWLGSSTGGRVTIAAEDLFGGESREGGIAGDIDVEMGHPTQGRNDYLQSVIGAAIPAFRGVVGVVLRQCYLGINPYLKKWSFRLQRIFTRQDGIEQWYPSKAGIGVTEFDPLADWTGHVAPAVQSWSAICWSPDLGRFVAVSRTYFTQNKVMVSSDGANWTAYDSPADTEWYDVKWAASLGIFCAITNIVGTKRALTSADGISWTPHDGVGVRWLGLAWSPTLEKFVCVGDFSPYAATSYNGAEWEAQAGEPGTWYSVVWADTLGLFVATGDNNVMTSPDGVTWTIRTAPTGQWIRVCWSQRLGLLVAVSRTGTQQVMTSPDGVTWTARDTPVVQSWSAVEWGDEAGYFIAVSSSDVGNTVLYSFNGIDWEHKFSNHAGPWFGLAWSPSLRIFCATSFNAGAPNQIMTTTPIEWGVTGDMNPAHIIRECLTDPAWGMGYPESDVDETSFVAAADRLFSEAMGISILWDKQTSIEDFVKEIIRHINGALYVDRVSGKFVLKLIRDDYVDDDLLTLGEDDIDRVEGYGRPAFGELINSVTVNYWDAATGKTSSIQIDDPALVQMQGGVNGTTLQYPGFTNADIAARVARSDLRGFSTPLLSCTIYANRKAAALSVGGVFKFEWPDLHDGYIVMRITGMALGDGRNNKVRLTCTEDVFAIPESGIVAAPASGWENPSVIPSPASSRIVVEAPYYELVQRLGQTQTDDLLTSNPDAGYMLASAAQPTGAINASILVDAGAGYVDSGVVEFCPTAFLSVDVGPAETVLTVMGGTNLDQIVLGTHAQVGGELVRIDAVTPSTITVGRGVLDTVPTSHLSGSALFAWDVFAEGDNTEYATGETINVKLLPTSGAGKVPAGSAPVDTVVLTQRAVRPYPPGNVKLGGLDYPSEFADATMTATWAHRDRTQQTSGTLADFSDGDIGPEPGVTYTARLLDSGSGVLESFTAISGTSQAFSAPPATDTVTLELWSERAGLESWQVFRHSFTWSVTFNLITEAGDHLVTEAGDQFITE